MFARACHLGEAGPEDFKSVVTDSRRMERATLEAVQRGLAGRATSPAEFKDFTITLDGAIRAVELRIGRADSPESHAAAAEHFMAEQAADLVEALHPDLPLPGPDHPSPEAQAGYDDTLLELRRQMRQRGHAALAQFITMTAEAVRDGRGTNIYPGWFDPELHSVNPELAELGYNALHNRPIPANQDIAETEAYLRDRIDAHAVTQGRHYGETRIEPASMAKRFLAPYLDPVLIAQFHLHDAEDRDYHDDGPINFREWPGQRVLHGGIDDPAEHASATYCRQVRDAIMNRGIAEDLEINRADLLAMSLVRNAGALQRLAHFLHGLTTQTGTRTEPEGYAPVIRWEMGTTAAWQTLGEITAGLSDNEALLERIDAAGRYLQNAYRPDDLINPESAGHRYAFLNLPTMSPGTDVDLPERVLIREALSDLAEARRRIEAIDRILEEADANRQRRLTIGLDKIRRWRKEGHSESFLEDMEEYIRNDYATIPTHPRYATDYQAEAIRISGELRGRGIASFDTFKACHAEEMIVNYDQAVRRLAHADFNICMVARAQTANKG